MQQSVVIDASGNARITNFGHTRIARDIDQTESTGSLQLDRWVSPELLLDESHVTKESDIFSFGMVIIEVRSGLPVTCQPTHLSFKVFTGNPPFAEAAMEVALLRIMSGGRPRRPNRSDFTQSLWALTQRCWSQKPEDRPDIREVIELLKDPSASDSSLNEEHLPHT